MSRTFAFLRAINVGGHAVTMERLRELFAGFGLRGVETFIASGNLIFETSPETEAALSRRIEAGLKAALGYEVAVFLRGEAELAALLQECPFREPEVSAAKALNVALLAAPLTEAQETKLQTLGTAVDAFRTNGREVWWLCEMKQSESTFSNAVFERALGVRGTFRSFSTLQRLAAKHLKA
ncbi:DUF1697 domain-containing protein [Geothrix campi]|uniref:DUF1697 domain-containing protein n=1 Tax=Geothrix campi TaxID=2966450 RepID=UPI002148720F